MLFYSPFFIYIFLALILFIMILEGIFEATRETRIEGTKKNKH